VAGDYRVRFALTEARVPKDNTKGEARYFFPRPDIAEFDAERKLFTLPFEYRLPTPQEVGHYTAMYVGRRSQSGQENVLGEALDDILAAVPDETLRVRLAEDQRTEAQQERGDDELPLILKRLKHFTRRQTSDYFIHKDLGGFLRRELEFYIKDQVLHLEDIEGDVESKRRLIRVIRRLAEQIIEFLAQIEDAQKRLWEKKKFVLRTDYLITMQHVPEEFWEDILSNEAQLAQWQEWFALEPEKDLFNSEGEVNSDFLRSHPTLVVNTQHFDRPWVRRLLEALPFEDLDEATDGLLIHSENYEALRLLEDRYREEVKCTYIDPPYNTGQDEFVYKDSYQESSWLAMMVCRLAAAKPLLRHDGVFVSSIDDNENGPLRDLLDFVFGQTNFMGTVVWNSTKTVTNTALLSVAHTYNFVYATSRDYFVKHRLHFRLPAILEGFANPDNDPRGPWKADPFQVGGVRPNQQYEITNPNTGEVYRPNPGCSWKNELSVFEQLLLDKRIVFGKTGEGGPQRKRFLSEAQERGSVAKTIWEDIDTTANATRNLEDIMGYKTIDNPKPTSLIQRFAQLAMHEPDGAILMDFFAGSGTTGHAAVNLNREDGGRRRFVVVEMAEYFDTVLLPRIAKVTYTPEWKDGKPERLPTDEEVERSPRLTKILRLESYGDAMHNVVAEDTQEAAEAREAAHKEAVGDEQYRLRYLVKLPLDAADTMLNLSRIEHPFDYTLEVLTEEGTRHQPVDLPQTFNYLYGLRPQQLDTWVNAGDPTEKEPDGRAYRVTRATNREQDRRIMVIWRDMADFDPEVERRFLEAKLGEEAHPWDEVLINGDTATPGVDSLDPLFKRLMETEEGR